MKSFAKSYLFLFAFIIATAPATSDEWTPKLTLDDTSCVNPILKMEKRFNQELQGLTGVIRNMKRMDLNHDGKVCVTEALQTEPSIIQALSEADTNQDKCVTPHEIRANLEARIESSLRRQFDSMGGRADQVVSLIELKNRYSDSNPTTLEPEEILREYDLNFDNQITWSEYYQYSIEVIRTIQQRKKTQG